MKTINLRCFAEGCGRNQEIRAEDVVVIAEPGAVLMLFFCEGCAAGWSRHEDAGVRQLVLHCGAEVSTGLRPARTLLGRPPTWPDSRPRTRVRDRFFSWLQNSQSQH